MRALFVMLSLLLLVGPARAATGERRVFEEKCLYCHSGAVIERMRLRAPEWRRLVARMRAHAPLLISPRDANVVVHYLVQELRLVPDPSRPARVRRVAREPSRGAFDVPRAPEPSRVPPDTESPVEPAPSPAAEAAAVESTSEPSPGADPEAETLGPRLIAEKCSKCHTVRRAFMKIDSVSLGDSVIERMRRKTGSGISPDDAEMLHRFVHARIPEPE